MSMKDFVELLTPEQKEALLSALSGSVETNETKNSEEVHSDAKDSITEDFQVKSKTI